MRCLGSLPGRTQNASWYLSFDVIMNSYYVLKTQMNACRIMHLRERQDEVPKTELSTFFSKDTWHRPVIL